jgi:hypothetical protein
MKDPKTTLGQQDDFYLNQHPNDDDYGEHVDHVDENDNFHSNETAINKQPWQDGDESDLDSLSDK